MKSLIVDESHRANIPAWANRVDRWHQLDETAFAFCIALDEWKLNAGLEKPDLILLALDGAANVADSDFVHSGGHSPAKFVYTLPNICMAVVLQMLGIHTKVYCLQKGSKTFDFALDEARQLSLNERPVWVFASKSLEEKGKRRVQFAAFMNGQEI